MIDNLKELMDNVSDNSSLIVWPRDEWGFTSELKKAIVKIASRVPTEEKSDLAIATLMVALAHLKKRRAKDARVAKLMLDETAKAEIAREPMERFGKVTKKEAA